ncbi:unnamed protein product [Didymodactylos carnosus]|uniref:Tetratricopeptide repeat protein n=1 Tax=Didymodactylos carnosus TaxID=1234261 RepID=A0A815DV98_9BILA|nr:unnamed protein product [Didymodactylos carnosus]CAF1301764.1 unnamed protein product [Didymodactylos carnosus]CAF3873626.1 unnamed protein product [Didymodactylos carnosus]CAF4127324.1 unnamed protein product [Didymodactylos carnosus]
MFRDYKKEIADYEKSIKMWQKYIDDYELNCSVNIAEIHRVLGLLYRNDELKHSSLENWHYDQLLTYYLKALEKCTTTTSAAANPAEVADLCASIALAYQHHQDHGDQRANVLAAIKYQQLRMQHLLKYCSPNDMKIGNTFQRLVTCYMTIDLWDEAIVNYEKALDIYIYQNNYNYYDMIHLCEAIVGIYTEQKGENYAAAIKYQLLKHEFTVKVQNEVVEDDGEDENYSKNFGIAVSHEEVADMYIKLEQYDLARKHLIEAKKYCENCDPYHKESSIGHFEEKLRSIEQFFT